MTDIYAEFGVTGAVMSEPSEGYNEQMIALPVDVRDGDDSITVDSEEFEEASSEELPEGEEQGEEQSGEESGEEAGEAAEFEAVGDVPEELVTVTTRIAESESAFNDMVADAAARGLDQESFAVISAEYEAEGELSPKSYEALAKVGYSKNFIDSFIAGQEAIGSQYMSAIQAYAGGEAKFQAIFAHLQASSPESADALENAIAQRDLKAIKGIINLAASSVRKEFGKPAERTLSKRATPAKVTSPKADGFESQAEMVKAMKDPKYGRDAAYTRSVELKVLNAKF